ncbi:MAG: hypothetical protein COW00_14190 [Bdellovibrio sp. CG12_big_fil_rev_8_21_14_0_65_39_13]|nr:MAG: hypothetical protein COW78_08065 [Bdellovibrio sp. CG22_combo_CG10-13_8_21_14_all_39_27]PIQ58763.1 MAG: hypothetical protein COW00_14190 [Bdellovibrio sp. CG12_big_fil_rev_8_21_14_0_65_39_13]PIR35556.1 MAG: hypothetical protein COV37_08770 [Bdellovibrio sp. CG11_big_fil_rev_8_21_14_0_20_39_38]PJB54310.1 MAG: hypothetical protein CO099_02330 [Bdellovibrio sp. CG_4_9_14_3_um_filter_39_7]
MKSLLIILCLSLSSTLFGAGGKPAISIEPLYGFETVQKFEPTAHTKNRAIYGIRAILGSGFLRGEAEVTQAKDTESFLDQDLKIEDTTNKAKAGLRFNFRMASLLTLYLRSGMQLKQSEITRTQAGVSTKRKTGFYSDPYAGGGLRVHFMTNFSLTADYTIIWSDYPVSNKKEYQTTLGFAARI